MTVVALQPRPVRLPSRRDEGWKYTDLARVVRELPPMTSALTEVVQEGGPFASLQASEIVVANGKLNWWPDDDDLPEGLNVFVKGDPDPPARAEALPMAALAAQRAADGVVIVQVEAGSAHAFSLRWVSSAIGTGHFARVGVMVEAGASLTLLESIEGEGDYFANHLLELFVEPGARLERVVIVDEPESAVSVTIADVHLSAGASFAQTVLTSGAKLQRLETHVRHPGAGAAVRLDGVYVLDGARHADLTTAVEHEGETGTTTQLTKGAVRDTARGVFQGRITVREGADGTDARMGHHALVLSDRAEVDAKPELEIWADDVSCAHGNTVGSLDQEALFYARARGMDEPTAKALLTEAFLGEVLDRMEHDGAREIAVAWVQERLK